MLINYHFSWSVEHSCVDRPVLESRPAAGLNIEIKHQEYYFCKVSIEELLYSLICSRFSILRETQHSKLYSKGIYTRINRFRSAALSTMRDERGEARVIW